VTFAKASDEVRERRQARPAAALLGFRADVLCASMASISVRFHGRNVPVCYMHEQVYLHWGDDAEANAEQCWGWTRDGSSES
jgi:hypothetical protein